MIPAPAADKANDLPLFSSGHATHNPPLGRRAAALIHQSNALNAVCIATRVNSQLLGELNLVTTFKKCLGQHVLTRSMLQRQISYDSAPHLFGRASACSFRLSSSPRRPSVVLPARRTTPPLARSLSYPTQSPSPFDSRGVEDRPPTAH